MTPRGKFTDSLLDLAWSQWTLLGVRGVAHAPLPNVALGLEEAMLLAARLSANDPRLRDEVLDWCISNARFISKPKLKGLLRTAESSGKVWFGPFARILTEQLGGRWPGARAEAPTEFVRSAKSSVPDLDHPELLALKLRAIFGVGARADVIGAVVVWPAPHFVASDLTFLGYTKRTLAIALDWLDAAGLLDHRREGNQVRYSWRRRSELIQLIEPLPVRFPRWASIVRVMCSLLHLFEVNDTKSERLARVETAKTLSSVSNDLQLLGIHPPTAEPRDWPAISAWAVDEAAQLRNGTSRAFGPDLVSPLGSAARAASQRNRR